MDNCIVSLYISFRYFQSKKKKSAHNLDLASFKLEHDADVMNGKLQLFEVPNIDIMEVMSKNYEVPWFRALFSSKLALAKAQCEDIRSAVRQLNSHINNKILTKVELLSANSQLNLLCKRALRFKGFDPNIIKTALEVLILRSYISKEPGIVNLTYTKLSPLFQYVKLDYHVLYKLTEDFKFNTPETLLKPELDIWDYIAALDSPYASSILGNKFFARAQGISSTTPQLEAERLHLLAIACYWLAKSHADLVQIKQAAKISAKPTIDQTWLTPQHSAKWHVLSEFIGTNDELSYFLFNRLNPELVTEEILAQIISLYKNTIIHHNFVSAIDLIALVYQNYYLPKFQFNVEARINAIRNIRSTLEKKIESDVSITTQGRRLKYFTQKLVEDSCPLTQQDFFNFKNAEDPIISLQLFQEPDSQQLIDCLAAWNLQAYQKAAFDQWVSIHGTDVIDRTTLCHGSEPVIDKIDFLLFRKFLNIKRLQESVLLMIISEKWFGYRKLNLLISLDPRLLEPKYLMHIEQLDFSKLAMVDIDYFNRYYARHGTLPPEITILGQTAVRDYRCNIVKQNLNLSLLRLFDELDELEPAMIEPELLPVSSSPRSCSFRFGT